MSFRSQRPNITFPLILCIVLVSSLMLLTIYPVAAASTTNQPLTAEECLDLGFVSADLRCSTCDELLKTTNDNSLDTECRQCCSSAADGDDSSASVSGASFVRGELHIVKRVVQRMVTYQTLVEKALPRFPSMRVVYQEFGAPRLHMYREGDSEPDVFPIHDWSTDTVVDFLEKKLGGGADKTKKPKK
eukprot:PhM_4_TR6678/c0_g1_i1/m.84941